MRLLISRETMWSRLTIGFRVIQFRIKSNCTRGIVLMRNARGYGRGVVDEAAFNESNPQ